MFIAFPVVHYSDDGIVGEFPPSVCFDLDATQAASYTSGQTWANLIASPADGSAQTDYDFFLGADGGASTDDPFFTGSAGDSAAFFAMDGGDFFTAKSITAPKIFNGAHKTSGTDSGPKWIALVGQLDIGSNQDIWGNSDGAKDGVRLRFLFTDNTRFTQFKDPSGTVNTTVKGSGIVDAETIYIITWDSSNAGSEQFWYRSTTGENWTATYSPATITADADLSFKIGTAGSGGSKVVSGTRIYAFSGGNSILTDSEAAGIFALYESAARHNRTYAV